MKAEVRMQASVRMQLGGIAGEQLDEQLYGSIDAIRKLLTMMCHQAHQQS
jgi:hypothetical protein